MADVMPGRTVLFPIHEHAARRTLAGEVHARPYELLSAPVRATHLVLVHGNDADAAVERAHLSKLLAGHGAEPLGEAQHLSRDLGALKMRYERHNEFSTYTFLRFDPFDNPFAATALEMVPADWLDRLPGKVLVATHIAVERRELRDPETMSALFDGNTLVGSVVSSGDGEVWTDLRLHADGCGRILVRDIGMSRGQTGRLVQRLCEIETYRMMALLAFPLARTANREIARLDNDIGTIITTLADPLVHQNDRELLERLIGLASEAERLDAHVAFRLSAARAYHAIVNQRIDELREARIPGVQTLREFMDRRLAPAMKTCESASERQKILAARISRTGDLLRTRVDIALEERNTDLLKSMNLRARLQLRLQATVEGVSIAAVSYYLVGLIGYAAKGLKAAGLHVDPDVVIMGSVPFVIALVAYTIRRLRQAVGNKVGGEK